MPVDDFETFAEQDNETEAADAGSEIEPNRAARRKKNRGKGKGATIPANAPEPQDHLAKQAARVAEAPGTATIVLTLWGEEIRIEQSELLNSWDWQVGAIQKNLLMMVKGLLGDRRFLWFTTRAQADGKTPIEAASEVMELFSKATGLGSAGK
ncbi:hypothetical protein [Rhodococcus sp. UNC363MFTsu5.1]|uniref:hypothetical protein n=1 Tax=Rhodococcus sp. UNC363MFTsu5.1 TaxID=1449069 RepID=UPI000480B766|nr:hypothetical protein [Rhodococcus sp. UNC363MFTsu5.1]